jgi:hypothetical protein
MKTFRWLAMIATLAVAATMFATTASAQATRTWVSGVGDDANPCSRTAPCKTFAGAISKTSAAGEINCLDSGGFGTLTITKSLTISCEGVTAGVVVAGSNGFVIFAAPTDVVVIKGLDIEGGGPSASSFSGIRILAAGAVEIDHCVINGFGVDNGNDGNGIFVVNSTDLRLTVQDTSLNNNARGGIWIRPGGSVATNVMLNRISASNNPFGVVFDGMGGGSPTIMGALRDSTIEGGVKGVTAGSNGALVQVQVDNVTVTGATTFGLSVGGANATMFVGHSTITGNTTGVTAAAGGVMNSYGDNRLNGNAGADGSFSATIPTR